MILLIFYTLMLTLTIYFLTVVFIVGSGMYYKAEPEGNIMLDVCKCIGVSLVHTVDINARTHTHTHYIVFKALI